MCDTIVATAEVTADGTTVFGKNSDREPNEAHHLTRIPAADHPAGSRVKCTYIHIPQVRHTFAVLLAKPFWMWGAEIGANEHGVVIGNEAVFTKVPYEKEHALTGMDYLRLALERASTAREATTVITELLAEYGQGGNCGFQRRSFYHNSFIIADPHDAWLLETAGYHWAARHIRGVYTISNGLTIDNEWDLASPDLVTHAVRNGWCKGPDDFSFARCYSDSPYTEFSSLRGRRGRTTDLLSSQQGNITVATVMAALRDHGVEGDGAWCPDKGLTGASVCMHARFDPVRGSQTTGSMVSHLHPDHPTHFVTGTAAPCTSIFKPIWLDGQLPDMGPVPAGTYDPATLYWRHEDLHRATLLDYAPAIQLYQAERDTLEEEFLTGALELAPCTAPERGAFASRCFSDADAAEVRWLERLSNAEL
ncbi:MAG: C69 family dipeptidase [Anaerolineae bacterium]|nr:C69 family dipeptidase [Anaerolineae bacterium]